MRCAGWLVVAAVLAVTGIMGCGDSKDGKPQPSTERPEPLAEPSKEGVSPAMQKEAASPAVPPTVTAAPPTATDQQPPQPEPESQPEPDNTVVARVNGVDIDATEHVARLRQRFQGEFRTEMLRRPLVDRMIHDELIRQEIQRVGIEVSDEELAEMMRVEVSVLPHKRTTEPTKVALYERKAAERKLLQVRGLLKAADEDELRRLYNREHSLNLQTVTFPIRPNAPEDVLQSSNELAREVVDRINNQQMTLQDAIRDLKDAEGRRVIVKPLIIKKGDKRYEELWEAAREMEDNAFSAPIRTRRGIVVFQMIRKRTPPRSFEEMKEELMQRSVTMRTGQARHRLLDDLKRNAEIEYLVEFADPGGAGGVSPLGPRSPLGPHMPRHPRIPEGMRRLPPSRDLPAVPGIQGEPPRETDPSTE